MQTPSDACPAHGEIVPDPDFAGEFLVVVNLDEIRRGKVDIVATQSEAIPFPQ